MNNLTPYLQKLIGASDYDFVAFGESKVCIYTVMKGCVLHACIVSRHEIYNKCAHAWSINTSVPVDEAVVFQRGPFDLNKEAEQWK